MASRPPDAAAPVPGDPLERDLAEVEREIGELRRINTSQRMDLAEQIAALERRAEHLSEEIARNPSPWQTVQLARHPTPTRSRRAAAVRSRARSRA